MLHSRFTLDTAAAIHSHPGKATNEAFVCEPLSADLPCNQTGAVIAKIENIFESITDSILNEKKELMIPLKTRPRRAVDRDDRSNNGNVSTKTSMRNITFPTNNLREAWRFSNSSRDR